MRPDVWNNAAVLLRVRGRRLSTSSKAPFRQREHLAECCQGRRNRQDDIIKVAEVTDKGHDLTEDPAVLAWY